MTKKPAQKRAKSEQKLADHATNRRNLTPKTPKIEQEVPETPVGTAPPASTALGTPLTPDKLCPTVKVPSPNDAIAARKNLLIEQAQQAVNLIIKELVEELAEHPETAMFEYRIDGLPVDLAGIIINSLSTAGWRCHFSDGLIKIEMPQCPVIAAPPAQHVSKVRAL